MQRNWRRPHQVGPASLAPWHDCRPGSLTWLAHKRPPIDDRWMVLFVDVQYNTSRSSRGWPFGNQGVLEFTSLVSVIHRNGTNVFPYEECHGEQCLRKNIRQNNNFRLSVIFWRLLQMLLFTLYFLMFFFSSKLVWFLSLSGESFHPKTYPNLILDVF